LSLFPEEEIITKEIESWKGFAERLPDIDTKVFMKMLNDCYKCSKAINAKTRPFPTKPLIMALLLSQHKLIEWLEEQFKNKQKVRVKLYISSRKVYQCPRRIVYYEKIFK